MPIALLDPCSMGLRTVSIAAMEAPPRTIYTWGWNTAAWNKSLHVSGYRIGCSAGDIDSCINEGVVAAEEAHVRAIVVSMELNTTRSPLDALTCSQLSLAHPAVIEVTFDDFVDRYGLMVSRTKAPSASWLETVLQNVKAKNAALQFGITLYEDELKSPYLALPYLSAAAAKSINDVHLYLHYRENVRFLRSYIRSAKILFPNAKIIAGSYAYDRVNYISCSPADKAPCTPEQDVALYKQSIELESEMLKSGTIAGIEFYPGFFGMEKQWQGWQQADACDSARLQQCIENTLRMRGAAAATLRSTMNW